ncbi:MAG: alpha/beta fold hydrolase, partial [Longimicrobiales bacterium]
MSTILDAPRSGTISIGALALDHGGQVDPARLAFATYGDEGAPTVLVLGGISAGRHLLPGDEARSGWWPDVAGEGGALDPRWHRLIGVDYIGGRGDSSSPAPGERWPVITTGDQAAAIVALLDVLGIERLHAVVGASYGGMVALALGERFADRVAHIIPICAAHRPHAMATAVRSVQRRIVRLGISEGAPQRAVAAARALAMTTYRTAAEFDERFQGNARVSDGIAHFPVDVYLDHHARDHAESFTAESFLTLSQSLDLHRVDPQRISTACTLICFDSDTLVPKSHVRALAAAVPGGATVTCIPSR